MRDRYAVTSGKAQRELGVRFRPFTQTLGDTLAWYQKYGFIAQVKVQPPAIHFFPAASFT